MGNREKIIGPSLIILSACLWGSMGIFVRQLAAYGFTSVQIVSIRLTLAALFFCAILLVIDRSGFKISLRDIPLFLGLGIGSILFFTLCYFSAIRIMSLSVAAILLYTSPMWIMIMSVLFFHEKLTSRKIIALLVAFAGCVLVSGVSGGGITAVGLLLGLGAGFGYGLYSILGTIALRRYSPYTITVYTFLFAALGSWFICRPADMASKFVTADNIWWLLVLSALAALVTAVIPFLAYTNGLRTVEASRAGILATIEPVVATLIGILFFAESLTLTAGIGIVLVLSAVIFLNTKENTRKNRAIKS